MLDKLLRKLPEFKGKHRIAELLFKEKFRSSHDIRIKGRLSCEYVLPNLQETVGRDIFINGIYEATTISFLNKLITPNGLFLDLGANIGSILIPLCKLRSDIKVIAVEAAPRIYEYLKKNIAINRLQNVQVFNNALFDTDDIEMLFYSPSDKYGKGSLSPVFSKDGIKVTTRKVDSIVRDFTSQKVDVIKVDVEGFEYFVFKGAMQLLTRDKAPVIVFEFVDWAEGLAMGLQPGSAQKLLLEYGYHLYKMEGSRLYKLDAPLQKGAAELFATKEIISDK